jgi:hypothetical protein
MATYYELLETPPASCESVARLWAWSENYQYPTPATLFLDLIGYSDEMIGVRLCKDKTPSLGYLELGMIGEALTAYSNRPQENFDYIVTLLEAEGNE